MIKAVVFDFGGVLQLNEDGNIMSSIAEIVDVPIDIFRKEYFNHNQLSNVKDQPWEEMIMEVVSQFRDRNQYQNAILERIEQYRQNKVWNEELISLAKNLQQRGYKTGIFSNNTSSLRSELEKSGIGTSFDQIVISAEIGYQKPQPEAFKVLFEKLQTKPEEVIFIDDTPRSLEGAEVIGYIPILYKNNNQIITELKMLGVDAD